MDISDFLIHFTKGTSDDDAFNNLCSIIDSQELRTGSGFIRGRYRCICFTEAPLDALRLRNLNILDTAYSRFGVMVPKSAAFERGGRPVIYQSGAEYGLLPEALRWRHVRYEPPRIDHSAEREWRIRTEILDLRGLMCGIAVAGADWAKTLVEGFDEQQDWLVEEYACVFDRALAEQSRERFVWPIYYF